MIDYAGPTNETLYPDETPSMVRVMAPADLPGGYELTVEGKESAPFTVTIPADGVKNGEVFLAPKPSGYKGEELINVPKGHWKDGLFDCFNYGFFHSSFWCSMCCPELVMGQVMQRMRLSWLGRRIPGDRALSTFKTVLSIVICYMIYSNILSAVQYYYMTDGKGGYKYYGGNQYYEDPDYFALGVAIAQNVGGTLFLIWRIYALRNARRSVREEFSIPEETAVGYEDCLYATFCQFCTVAQMARHTGEYETHEPVFYADSGLPKHAPFAAPTVV